MKQIVINHNGFHGRNCATIRVPKTAQPGDEIEISRQVANRINALCCNSLACECGEQIAYQIGYNRDGILRYAFHIPTHRENGEYIMIGWYPQS